MVVQSKNYTVTYFPLTRADGTVVRPEWEDVDWKDREDHFSYTAYGIETCPTTGKRHCQGFVVLLRKKTEGAARTLIQSYLKGAHVELMKGNLKQNKAYCEKEGELQTWGVPPKVGERTDLKETAQKVKDGELTVDEILDEDPMTYHVYGRTLEKIQDKRLRQCVRTWVTKGEWYYGATGTGKSRKAFEGFAPETHYIVPNDNGWWDTYQGQETVIIDEFRGAIPYAFLLQLMDRYPLTVKRRGKEPIQFLAKKIIITSSMHPAEVYNNLSAKDSLAQLMRRCTVTRMGPPDPFPIFHPTSIPASPAPTVLVDEDEE